MLWRRRQAGDETFFSAAQISAQRHSPPPSPTIIYPTSRSHNNPRRSPVANLSLDCPSVVPQLSLSCPSSSPRLNPTSTPNTPHLSQSQAQTKLNHQQQSVPTTGSNTAPPSSCLHLIKSWRLNTPTHHLYQPQIHPCLQLIKPQRSSHRSRLVRTTRPQLPRYPVLAAWVTTHLQLMQAQPIDWTRIRHGSNTPK